MRKQQKIRAVSYIRVGGELVEFSQLSPQLREQAAVALKCSYLNALFAGKAEFYPKESATETCGAEEVLA